jgi:hypothetical protein
MRKAVFGVSRLARCLTTAHGAKGLAVAKERRATGQRRPPRELDGRSGLDPARDDDWDETGLASDL